MLRHMTLAEMVGVSGQMVDKTARRETFLSIAEVAPLHPQLVLAHSGVLAVQPVDAGTSAVMKETVAKGTALDVRHDHLARAGVASLEHEKQHCLAAEEPNPARAAMCDRATALIFPDGLSCINISWGAEAGNTARVAKLLKDQPEIAQFLSTIAVPEVKTSNGKGQKNQKGAGETKKTLLDTMNEWIAVGRELQKVEELREDLESKEASGVSPKTIFAARAQWIRVVNGVLTNLGLSTAPAEKIDAIRMPILAASVRAAKRYGTDSKGSEASDGVVVEEGAPEEESPTPAPKAGKGKSTAAKVAVVSAGKPSVAPTATPE